jgi:hypothetical protein
MHRREDLFLQKAKNERKGLCPQNSQMDADEEFLFRFCVNRRVLRASLDSVAAGRAGSWRLCDKIPNQKSKSVAVSRSDFSRGFAWFAVVKIVLVPNEILLAATVRRITLKRCVG